MVVVPPFEYLEYRHAGLCVQLPTFLKIKHAAPRLYATGRLFRSSIIIQFDPSAGEQNAWEQLLRQKSIHSTQLESRIVREGEVERPYPGYERIIEHRVIDHPTGNVNFGWGLACYPKGHFLQIQVGGFIPFSKVEDAWRHVVESIRVLDE
jgi:hypothetical protein